MVRYFEVMTFPDQSGDLPSLRVAVVLLASLLLSLLCFRQAVERTPISRDTVGFKFSKTLELPHKKAAAQTIAVVGVQPPTVGRDLTESVRQDGVNAVVHALARRPASSRAPPLA
jgi:hypothetical protein